MGKFDNISGSGAKAKEEKSKVNGGQGNFELEQARKKAREDKEALKEAEAGPTVETNEAKPLDVDGFTAFIGSDREIPVDKATDNDTTTDTDTDFDNIDAGGGEGDDFSEERTKKDQTWFRKYFGGKEDSPVSDEASAELDEEMYAASGSIGAEITDNVIPGFINSMAGSDDVKEYQASETQKEGLARAWELYLRSIKAKVTPLTYLLGKIAIVYGGKFVSAMFMYLTRLREIGLHWPWSNGWKKKFKYVNLSEQPDELGTIVGEQNFQQPHHQQPQQAQPQQAQPAPEPKLVKVQNGELMKCMYDGTEYRSGNGFPKTSKTNPQYIDSFATYKNYMTYLNKNGFRNKKKK